MARQVVQVLGLSGGQHRSSVVAAQSAVTDAIESHSGWVTFASLMIFCGIFNAGVLAIAEALIAEELNDFELIAAAVGTAVLLGPIVVAQIVGGVISLTVGRVSIGRAVATISLLPFTPGWLISAPVAVWALRWMRRQDSRPTSSPNVSTPDPAQRSESSFWSTTALFLLPESRWGRRLVAIINGAGIAVAIGVFAIVQLGLYPTTMNYRIVDSSIAPKLVSERINQRLYPDATARLARRDQIDRDSDTASGNAYVQIRILKRNQDQIAQRLSIEGNLELVWLIAGNGQSNSTTSDFVVAPGLPLESKFRVVSEEPIDGRATTVQSPTPIESSDVAGIEVSRDGLVLKLSSDGRKRLLDNQPPLSVDTTSTDDTNQDSNRLVGAGLLIDGVIEGFAAPDAISIRELVFQLAPDAEAMAPAIAAAMRGPKIPSELELID